MNVRLAVWHLWDRVLDGLDGAREATYDAIAGVRDRIDDAADAIRDRLAFFTSVAAVMATILAVGAWVVLFRIAAPPGVDSSVRPQPAPVLRSPVSISSLAPIPGPSLAIDQ